MSQGIQNWLEEKQAAHIYEVIAEVEPEHRELFLNLAKAANRQAQIWAEKTVKLHLSSPPKYTPDFRTRVVILLIRWLGPKKIKMILAAMKVRGMSIYSAKPILSQGHVMPTTVEEVGGRHKRTSSAGNLRAAVFGINDGLVSNASLILGIAGASADPHIILLAGMAGTLAGAFSMAAGEYISVRSQREMFEYQIGLEREELELYPREEAEELALIYKSRGLTDSEAKRLADHLIANKEKGLETLAREELGLNPSDLVSPWGATLSSFLSFAIGALIPLLPFLLGHHPHRLLITILMTGLSLFGVGAIMSLFTGKDAFLSGIRMVFIGGGAGLLTYMIGRTLL